MDKKNIIVTGGTGFVGRNLIGRLSEEYDCINLGRNQNKHCLNLLWDCHGNLPEEPLLGKSTDYMVHCAAIVGVNGSIARSEYIDINVRATQELLDFAVKNRIEHFVYISTGSVYGESANMLTEEDLCDPKDIYGMTKYFGELLCNNYRSKLDITVLRLFFPYGEGQSGRLIPALVNKIRCDEQLVLNEQGLPLINPIYISDLADIVLGVIKHRTKGVFNVSGDEVLSVKDICNKIAGKLNKDSCKFFFTNKKVPVITGSNRKICDLLNYKMKVGIDEGLERVLAGELTV